ncbi:DHA2 family multidrug resistance protein [Nitrospirillum amazonense]|uniref:DHA2 family multidrug resistance protein n=1 Tax=Nitrospirillum amazonense TaxID=28077 RepID=A0A560EJY2_9PROT|nr:DHA2 family multidrug resistance protein [Nitrospirillum amazonense]
MSEGLPPPEADHGASSWRPKHNPYLVAMVVTVATFMEVLDTTIINVALPHIAGSLSVGTDESTWTLTSYLVANGIVLPVSGWLGRLMGRKNYFLLSIIMFTVSSLLCGLSTSLPELIIFRLMQGFFGGGLQPNQQSILLDTFEPAKRATAFGVTAVAIIAAPIMGPTLGGWITDNFSWRWVFLINVPVGVIATFAISAVVEDPPWAKAGAGKGKRNIDVVGLSLIAAGFACLQIVLDRGEQEDWFSSGFIQAFAVGAVLGLVGAVVWLLDRPDPIVNLRVWKNKDFAIGTLFISIMAATLYGSAVLIPQLAQSQLGYTATWSGMILSPGGIMILIMIPIITRVLLKKFQARFIVATGFFLLGIAMFYTGTITPQVSFLNLMSMRLAQTFGTALLMIPISTVAFASVPREMNGDAAALYSMARNLGGSIGIALVTAYLTQRSQVHQAYLVEHLSDLNMGYQMTKQAWMDGLAGHGLTPSQMDSSALGGIYRTLVRQAAILGYVDVFRISGVVAFCVVPLAFFMKSTKAAPKPAAAE